MKEFLTESVLFGCVLTVAAYQLGLWLKAKTGWAVLNPLLVAVVLIIAVLLVGDIDLESYNRGADYISFLLTPATVCLAVPLYQQLQLLKRHGVAILLGILSGVLTSVTSILAMAWLFKLSHTQYVTLLPKSVTTAIGMGISEELGGIPAITVAVIVITGILGHVTSEGVLKLFSITHPIAKGVAIGSASHAIGTSKALEMGEVEGAMSSLSIALAGVITVAASMVYANFL